MLGKPIYESKTFWFNILALLVAVAGSFGYADFAPATWVDQGVIVATALINIAIRVWGTKGPIDLG